MIENLLKLIKVIENLSQVYQEIETGDPAVCKPFQIALKMVAEQVP